MKKVTCYWLILVILGLYPSMGWSQSAGQEIPPIFTVDQFFEWIESNHPLARAAQLLPQEAAAEIRKAQGNFDPKLLADYERKQFDNKEYFSLMETVLKMPTWYGLEFKAGYQLADGVFLNPENNLPQAGQAIVGVNVNLLQGLWIDQRRTELKLAQNSLLLSQAERDAIYLSLLQEANLRYWDWVLASEIVKIYEEALQLAQDRFEGVKLSYEQGFSAAVDTLESSIQVKNRANMLLQSRLLAQNTLLGVQNYLWTVDTEPYDLAGIQVNPSDLTDFNIIPPSTGRITALRSRIIEQHPLLRQYNIQQKQFQIEEALNKEMLKPRLTVGFNILGDGARFGAPAGSPEEGLVGVFTENYKWEAQFSVPLFLRKERGNLDKTRIKIEKNRFKWDQKELDLVNKLDQNNNELVNLNDQIQQLQQIEADYQALLSAEQEKFTLGESSLFLVNSRELKLIEIRQKLAATKVKFLTKERDLIILEN